MWIEVFRKTKPLNLESFVAFEDVATCLPVVQEVLQGFRDESAYRVARDAMKALPTVESPLGSDVFAEAIDLYRRARRTGLTLRSSVDCIIAACAIRHDLQVMHRDRDFELLASVSSLRVRKV